MQLTLTHSSIFRCMHFHSWVEVRAWEVNGNTHFILTQCVCTSGVIFLGVSVCLSIHLSIHMKVRSIVVLGEIMATTTFKHIMDNDICPILTAL